MSILYRIVSVPEDDFSAFQKWISTERSTTPPKEASMLKAPYVTAKHGLIGLCEVVAKEGAKHNVRANVICPGYVHTSLVDKQIPEQAKALGISEEDVVKKVMLKDTVDGEFTTTEDVASVALFFLKSCNIFLSPFS